MKFKAINDWVFISRDKMEKTHLGLEISEKCLTKNQKGVITHSVNKKHVGCRVHIPHYRVVDYDIGGKSYAVVRVSDLFAKEVNGTYRPMNRYIRVRKCVNDHYRDEEENIVLYKTDKAVEETNWVEIIDVSDDCKHFSEEDVGAFCVSPESGDKLQRLEYSKDYMLHEDEIKFTTDGNEMIKPKNNRVIVKKEEFSASGEIVLPDDFKTEADLWRVVSFGDGIKTSSGKIIAVDLSIDSLVVLQKDSWTIIEVGGVEYAVVSEDDIVIEVKNKT